MISIAEHMDGPDIAAEVRMQRQVHKGSFLLVEGATDIKRFARVVVEGSCEFVNCFGKPNVSEAIELLYDDGFPGALGLIDADFDRLLNRLADHEGLITSTTHDFDLDVCTSTCFERYLSEVADQQKVADMGGPRPLLENILTSLKPLAALRFANEKHRLGYQLKNLNLEKFYDGGVINVESMINDVSQGKFAAQAAKDALLAHVNRYASSGIDLLQAVCGHDVCEALGIALRARLGTRRFPQTWRSEVELHFRLTFDLFHLHEIEVGAAISKWEVENQPYRILRAA